MKIVKHAKKPYTKKYGAYIKEKQLMKTFFKEV